jgi:Luciferase-like monooxygenase
MQIGIDSFAAAISDPATGLTLTPVERMHHLLEEIELADRVGLDVFGIGEHHRAEFLDSAPVVILSAAAARTHAENSPHQRRHRSQRLRSRSCFSRICHARPHLPRPRRNCRRSRFFR